MKLFLKILLFILTMMFITVGEIKSSIVVNFSQEKMSVYLFQKEESISFSFENHLANSCKNGENVVTYSEWVRGIEARAAKGGVQTIVGEGIKRVSMEAAKRPNSVILNNMPTFTGAPHQVTSQMMQYNRQWMLQQMRSSRSILDIGIDPMRANPSIFYQMEQSMMRNYLKLHPNAFQIILP